MNWMLASIAASFVGPLGQLTVGVVGFIWSSHLLLESFATSSRIDGGL